MDPTLVLFQTTLLVCTELRITGETQPQGQASVSSVGFFYTGHHVSSPITTGNHRARARTKYTFLVPGLVEELAQCFLCPVLGLQCFQHTTQLGQPGLQLAHSLGIPPTQAPRGSAHRLCP